VERAWVNDEANAVVPGLHVDSVIAGRKPTRDAAYRTVAVSVIRVSDPLSLAR
jgi:hypothetical protein